MHINNKTICWSIQGNNCYYECLPANHWNNTSHCLVWDLLFVATFEPFLVFWRAFLFVVFAETVLEVLLAFCVLAFLRLPLPVSPPWNAWDWYITPSWCTKASCFLVFLFSFFSFFCELQGYSCNQLDRSYQDLSFTMTRASLAAPGCQVQGPTVNR